MTKREKEKRKTMDKLAEVGAECKVWIGGLGKDVSRGKLVNHIKETAKPHLLELMSRGTAVASFKTEEEAQTVIASLNGSDLEGKSIEVDVWTKKEKKDREPGEKRNRNKKKKKMGVSAQVLKQAQKGKAGKAGKKDDKLKLKIKAVDHALKLWVGGMSKTTTWKELKTHFVDLGCEVHLCDLGKPGNGVVTFKTEDEATSALGIVNGTELGGQTIEVDVWTKPERKEKKAKTEVKDEV